MRFETKVLPSKQRGEMAPDGSEVRELPVIDRGDGRGGGMAHFTLGPKKVAQPSKHKTVDEIWYFLSGRGRMWRMREDQEAEVVDVFPGLSLTIPRGTAFQFRNDSLESLVAMGVTMPPWPGLDEAFHDVEGKWPVDL